MLTPDEGHLDRRIAQEAGTLAATGWEVQIYPAVDPGLNYQADLPTGVTLLVSPGPPRGQGAGRRILRSVKRTVAGMAPTAGRIIESTQYRRRDIGREIADANRSHLLGLGQFDLVFAHDVPVMPLATSLCTAWGSPLISDLHEVFPEQDGHITSQRARRYWRGLEGAGLAASQGVICVNAAVAEYVRAAHAPAIPMAVVQNCVPYVEPPTTGPTLRSVFPILDPTRIMLFVGSLRAGTNLEVLIDGFAQADLPGWALAILGEGPLQRKLEGLVRRRGLASRVHLGRHIAQRDLIQVAASADVALLPYQAHGFNHLVATPNKLFEYIQARLPIAASRLPMVERIVSVHGNGGFVDFSTAPATAAGLVAFVRDAMLKITPAMLEAAAHQFSWESEEPALLHLTDQVMAQAAKLGANSR